MKSLKRAIRLAALFTTLAAGTVQAGPTLDAVKARDALRCGVSPNSPGFSEPDSTGKLKGFSVDFCRAVAAAVLGSADKVQYVTLTPQTRFAALQSKEVDVLIRQTTVSFARDTTQGFLFGPIELYDSQGFMVPRKLGVKSAKELDGAAVCVVAGSNSETTISNYFRQNGLRFRPVSAENAADLRRAFFAGRCDVFSSDFAVLAAMRSVASQPDDYVLLPEIVGKSPLAPLVRRGDDEWFNIVRWVIHAPAIAEEFGITAQNVDAVRRDATDAVVLRFLGREPNFSKGLGIADDWAYQIVKQVGNYDEIFQRNLGSQSPLKLDRGQNRLHRDGGLLYPPPF